MPRRNRKKGQPHGPGGEKGGPGENWGGEHMRQAPTPLIAVSPDGTLLAVAFGCELRVWDVGNNALATLSTQCPADQAVAAGASGDDDASTKQWHTDAIRALRFDSTGTSMCTAGDDKKARVWRVESKQNGKPRQLTCKKLTTLPKKACAATFSTDGKIAAFADKFGDVHGLGVGEGQPSGDDSHLTDTMENKSTYLFGHCCSIITDAVALASDLIATADRDFKIRIAKTPSSVDDALNPKIGIPEVQSFCHGHAAFVACLAAVPKAVSKTYGPLLLSGGGDGAVRLWRCEDGEALGSVTLAEPRVKIADSDDEEGDDATDNRVAVTTGEAPREAVDAPAVLALAVGNDGTVFASVEERPGEVAELAVTVDDTTDKVSLTQKGWVPLPAALETSVPSSLAYDVASKKWWGVAQAKSDTDSTKTESVVFVLGGEAAEISVDFLRIENVASRNVSLGDAMRKRSYDEQKREERKKQRNDFKKGGASVP